MAIDSTEQDLDDLFSVAKAARRPLDADAYLNLAFLQGRQWTAWDGQRIFEPALDPNREKVTDNRIGPVIRTEISKMTKTRPVWLGVPRTQSDEDVTAARYAELAMEDIWKTHGLQRKLRQALLWARVCGAGYWKVWWDPTLGKSREILRYHDEHPEMPGQAVKDIYGRPLGPEHLETMPPEVAETMVPSKVAMGDICFEVKSFFSLYADPLAGEDGLESCEWIIDESVVSQDYAAKHFDVELQADTDPSIGAVEARMPGWEVGAAGPTNTRGIKLREYWSKDKHVIWAPGSNEVVLEEANPYPWLPYAMFRGVPMPGRFYPDSVVTQLRPRQVDLNKRLSQIAESSEYIANPALLVPSSMGDDFNWQGLPGEQIGYQDSGAATSLPSFLQAPPLPAYVENDISRIENSIMEISGQHEVTGASVPTGVTAASAINLLQEADDTRLGPDIADMEEALTHAGTRALWFVRNRYTDERHLRVGGEDGAWEIAAFKGEKVEGCDHVEVQAGSGMPQSKAAQQAAIQQVLTLLVQNGVPVSERSMRRVMREYQVGGLEAFFSSQSHDESQIQEEHRQMGLGVALDINSYDNDAMHIEGHSDFMKTARYGRLADQIKQLFEFHLEAHQTRVAQMAPPPEVAAGEGGSDAPSSGSAAGSSASPSGQPPIQ